MTAITTITVLALILRVWQLGVPSLWYDEGATLWYAVGGTARWGMDTHPPLYYALVHFWLRFGNSEFWLRILSVIPAVATVPLVFSLGKKLFGVKAGLLSATLLALMAFHIDHSQQARMYTFLVFFYTCALWALIAAAGEMRRWHWVTYVLAATLMSYSQGIGILYVAMVAVLFFLISPAPLKVSAWTPFAVANIAVFALFIPWLLVLKEAKFRVGFLNWVAKPTWISIPATLFAFVCKYIPFTSIPHFKSGILLLRAVAVAIATVPTLLLFWIALRRAFTSGWRRSAWIAVSAFVLPFLLVFLLSVLVTPMYIDRVLLPAAIGLVLILGASVGEMGKTESRTHYLIGIVIIVSCLNCLYYFQYRDKEDFRSLSVELQRSIRPGQSILFVADSSLPQFLIEYYDPKMKLAAARKMDLRTILRPCHVSPEECLDAHSEDFTHLDRLWIVYAHDGSIPQREAVQHWLDTHFVPLSTQSYRVPDLLRLAETKASGF